MIEIRPSVKLDVYELYPILQEADKQEVLALGFTPRSAVWYSYRQGLYRQTAFLDGKVAAMWGVGGVPMGFIGQPYFLSSPLIRQVPAKTVVSIYRQEVETMLRIFPVLENYVDADYYEAIKLLRLTGFTISDKQPFGRYKKMFHKFSIQENQVSRG